MWSPTPVTSPVVVIGREQSANLSRHSVILQQKTLTGGCGKRGYQGGLGKPRGRLAREKGWSGCEVCNRWSSVFMCFDEHGWVDACLLRKLMLRHDERTKRKDSFEDKD